MSQTQTRMPLAFAEARAQDIIAKIGIPEASVTAIVGSIRRRKPDVGDIEFLVPTAPPGATRDTLFDLIDAKVKKGDCMFGEPDAFLGMVKGHKPHFLSASYTIRFDEPDTLIQVEFYRHTHMNRGWQLLMRTGPAELHPWFLTKWKQAHDIKGGPASVDGHLVDRWGKVIPVSTEEECFAHIRVPFIPPEKREAFARGLGERSWG